MVPLQRVSLMMGTVLLAVVIGIGSAEAKHLGLDGKEDFGQVAREGFGVTVDNTGNFVANVGSKRNGYDWSGWWFLGKFITATARDVLCFLGFPDAEGCPPDGVPTMDQAAEIWAYTPTSFGEKGTWERVYQSPQVSPFLLPGVPRDVGYRGMVECNANGTAAGSPTPHLYIAAFGVGGHILWTDNGVTFQLASTNGLQNSLIQLSNGIAELGYRALLCWKGRLWTAPSGSDTDTDLPPVGREVVLANANPMNAASPWQTIVNVKTAPAPLGDPGNLGVFSMTVFNDFLYLGVSNRTTGFELWKGDGANCNLPPGSCTITWTKVIDNAAGRPVASANAGVSDMQVFNGALYIGVSDAAAFNPQLAELIRVNSNGTWDLIMGVLRPQSAMAGFPTFNCNLFVGDPDGGGPLTSSNWCLPLSGRREGFGDSNTSPGTPSLTTAGRARYVWRLEVHDDGFGAKLYAGSLDLGASSQNPAGFDILRSADGVNWVFVNRDGLGNTNNYGVRTLVSVPGGPGGWPGGSALIVGTANPFTNETSPPGGLEVFVGTCGPPSSPVAVAAVTTKATRPGQVIFDGTRYVAFDDESYPSPGNSSVTVTLDGRTSYATFCGDLLSYEWRDTTGGLPGTLLASGGPVAPDGPKLTINTHQVALSTGSDYTDYTLNFCVTDEFSQTNCKDLYVRATHKLPPTAQIQTTPPWTLPGGSNTPRVTVIDLDGSGAEAVSYQGTCSDPESSLVSCTWTAETGVTVAGQTLPFEDADPASFGTSYSVSAPVTDSGGSDVFLTATDDQGNAFQTRVQIRARAAVHDVAVTAVTPTTVPATEGVAQNVTVTVVNSGHFAETFDVTLADAIGGTVSPAQSVSLAGCVDTTTYPGWAVPLSTCPSASRFFSWTATQASVHNLTATAATVTGETATANNSLSVQVDVTPVNDPPVANDDPAVTNQNKAVTINILGNDTDEEGGALSVNGLTQPANGTVVPNANKTVKYTPKKNFAGQDTFTYTAKDPSNAVSNVATVTVTVNATTSPTSPSGATAALTATPKQVHVAWTDRALSETRYEVERCLVVGTACAYVPVDPNLPANTTGYDSTVPAAGKYRFRVRACNGIGCSGYAQTPKITVP